MKFVKVVLFPLQDETPLFLAAKEGSFEVAKVLLDHYANRDATDHMDRLPRDIAQERMHHDIVKLLTEYRISNGAMGMPGAYGGSPSHMVPSFLPPGNGKQRQKNRNRKSSVTKEKPLSPTNQPTSVHLPPVHKPRKKKKPTAASSSSTSGSPNMSDVKSPTDSLESPKGMICELPPSYETAVGGHVLPELSMDGGGVDSGSMQALHADAMKTAALAAMEVHPDWLTQMAPPQSLPQQQQHPEATSNGYVMTTSPMSSHTAQSPPLPSVYMSSGGPGSCAYSPASSQNHSPFSMSPGGSSQAHSATSPSSTYSVLHSPPQTLTQQLGSVGQPPNAPSPNRASPQCGGISPMKKMYPTSPTHLQAMHQHMTRRLPPQQQQQQQQHPQQQQQQHQQHHMPHQDGLYYDYGTDDLAGLSLPYPSHTQVTYPYPSPPSQHSLLSSEPGATPQHHLVSGGGSGGNTGGGGVPTETHYLTPSPSSPGQWSSSSPHSAQSDWSDNVSSPPMAVGHGHMPIPNGGTVTSSGGKNAKTTASNGLKSRTEAGVYL